MGSTDVINAIKEKTGKFLTKNVLIIILGILLLSSISFIFYQSMQLTSTRYELGLFQRQNESITDVLHKEMQASYEKVKELEKKLAISNSNVSKLKTQIQKEREVYASVKLPKDKQEILDRLNAMDYHPR